MYVSQYTSIFGLIVLGCCWNFLVSPLLFKSNPYIQGLCIWVFKLIWYVKLPKLKTKVRQYYPLTLSTLHCYKCLPSYLTIKVYVNQYTLIFCLIVLGCCWNFLVSPFLFKSNPYIQGLCTWVFKMTSYVKFPKLKTKVRNRYITHKNV